MHRSFPSGGPRGRSCRGAREATDRWSDLDGIVASYVAEYRPGAEREREFYGSARSLSAAIQRAASCVTERGTRHPHQSRIPRRALDEANASLQYAPVGDCRTFAELHDVVDRATRAIHGIAELTVYDIACRIGAYLGVEPEHVYLHRGTRKGAKALGLSYREPRLAMSDLPAAFRCLRPGEVEDALCIYKARLATPGLARGLAE